MVDALQWDVMQLLHQGVVIPAHPLALRNDKTIDEERQRALTNYYMDSGAGGVAVGVHTTQFEIREEGIGLYEPVLQMAAEEVDNADLTRPFIKVAGLAGPTEQAVTEAGIAKRLGYDLGLLSMGGLSHLSESELLERVKIVAETIPVFGFYLQPAVGGRILSYEFWRQFAEVPGVFAIKLAPFNRYQTLEVVRAVCHSSRNEEIALYTGNDDSIVEDLLTDYRFNINGKSITKPIVGGLLGQWAVWTSKAVDLLQRIKSVKEKGEIPSGLLTEGKELTDVNAALFDPAHHFKGCIAGINEVLRRQGLLQNNHCLSDNERLSPGQTDNIDRIYQQYPHLHDNEFVQANLDKWIKAVSSDQK